MLRRLHHHPSMFVQLHTAVTFGAKRIGLEMEYIDAPPFCPASASDLQHYMRSLLSVRFLVVFWLHLTIIACQVLHVLHTELGIIHGDIKPENVLYLPDSGRVKLIDFESADFGPSSLASAPCCIASQSDLILSLGKPTAGYEAPEIRSLYPPRMYYASDIYAAGCTFVLLVRRGV